MTLVGFEPGTPGWQANVLTNTQIISRFFLVTKSQYLNLVQKVGTFLISAYPIVDSDRACLELPRTVFRSYGISKWLRLDSGQVCTVSYGLVHYLCSKSKCVFYIGIIEEIILKTNQCVRHSWLLQYHFYQRVVLSFHNVPIPI